MAETFDPYYKWLGIPPKDQPPHHYRLLGIELFEADREVIDAAANRLMGYLKDLAVGDETAYSQKLLNEIARARLCLLTKDKKAAYDQELREKLQSDAAAPPEGQQLPSPPTRSALPPAAPPPPRTRARLRTATLSRGGYGHVQPCRDFAGEHRHPCGRG
jgi:hypothetical protein